MITPKLMAVGRKHYVCHKLKGVPLENEGGGGTRSGHWERAALGNEIMSSGPPNDDMRYSIMTLALLEDSGWYEVDFSLADEWTYGKGRGCGFLEHTCHGKEAYPEFCDKDNGGRINPYNGDGEYCKDFMSDGCKMWNFHYRKPGLKCFKEEWI